ncbi:multidrug resistance protein homolog 49-like [Episyrphus balteatus]|uniref:multidrug resistance protein homolog 49-like n=1 Tax=Episyrphus balteatus TaxID=286459 RepID=UPI002485B931|nr:multidrug resistance protein homolog 49-like [Episyrphus balteatus]XP_055858645.1 multidrug resistance protein homolog 49-like [Episyrphus balteatus]XP_055858646.1 multidrug resistance protein homolog 49-like [Episyrphus balteatus]XP_055858647.1 multidrug resistance protein homolog 49-like [Episyrphus balteatus]
MPVKKYDIQLSEKRNQIPTKIPTHRKLEDEPPTKCTESNKITEDDCAKNLKYFQLYRFSTITEKLLIALGLILSTLSSFGIPYSLVNGGEFHLLLIERHTRTGTSSETSILKLFGGGRILTNASKEDNMSALKEDALAFFIASLIGAILEWILLAASVDIFNRIAVKQINRIRKQFLASLLRQDISWYDTTSDSNFASKMTEDLSKLKEGIGEKVAIFTNLIMSFVITMILSFFFSWNLILIIMICCPIIIISTIFVEKIQSTLTEKELKSYCESSSIAEEVIGAIRTVFAFSGEKKEIDRYNQQLVSAVKAGHRKGLYCGICAGTMWIVIYICFSMGLFYAAKLAISKGSNEPPAVLLALLLGIILEAQSVGFAMPHLEAFGVAKSAAKSIFSIIDRKTAIDPFSEEGLRPEKFKGTIKFDKVHFKYPSRANVNVLRGLTVSIKAGQTVAFVGPSGCGKTTCLQLLQRFYDPEEGSVELDGFDVRKLNIGWLRSQIGVVGQEPVLFSASIEENVRYGNPLATFEDIEEACKQAYCHDFIVKLPNGYQTMVGEKGSTLSGGQKQRIAIARALVKNPKILLLDEATSALDPNNEKLVHKALEAARKGRTTLMVAHRLATVRNADLIVFIKDGTVMEQGSHEELIKLKGFYFGLMNASERSYETWKPQEKESSTTPKNLDSEVLEKVKLPEKETQAGSKYFFKKFVNLNSLEWKYLFVGSLSAILQGSTGVVWANYFGEYIGFLSNIDNGFEEKSNTIVMVSIGIGILAGLASFLQIYMLNIAGTNLTSRLRQMAFKSIVSQNVEYFDDQKNSVGALCSRLSGDCSSVQRATGSRLGIVIQSGATLMIATIMSLVLSWNLTLVTLVMIPFVIGSILFESNYTEKSSEDERLAMEKASQIAVESVASIRTINSLGQEKYVLERYTKLIDLADEASRQKTRFRGIVFGFGDAAQCIVFGISLFYGGLMVADGKMEFKNIIKISEALQLGTWMLGQAFAYAPDFNEASISMKRLLKLFDLTLNRLNSPEKRKIENSNKQFDISYKNIGFHYPTRRMNPILQEFNLKISKNSTVALVGPSGCGKSTCIQLLLRYYDPTSGSLTFNRVPTHDYQIDTLRSQIGFVSQEPVLFDRTIAENIAYGDNFRETIPISEIIESAKKSNIHDFIVSLPQGYSTSLSSKGSQLSCGQKQRIAIARAFIRNPKILILDEATSALDMQSEKLVQEALEGASCGRTCIMIAQRLATIRNADMICVVENGRVIEQGTHEELVQLKGSYAELLSLQQ